MHERPPRATALGTQHGRRRRRDILLWGTSAGVCAVVLCAAVLIWSHPSAPPGPGVVTASSRQLPLLGDAAEGAALYMAIDAGLGDSTALVTRTVYAAVPALRRANRAAGNEAVLRGPATLQLDALDNLTAHRFVTVVTVCTTPMRYRWTITAVRWRNSRPFGAEAQIAAVPTMRAIRDSPPRRSVSPMAGTPLASRSPRRRCRATCSPSR